MFSPSSLARDLSRDRTTSRNLIRNSNHRAFDYHSPTGPSPRIKVSVPNSNLVPSRGCVSSRSLPTDCRSRPNKTDLNRPFDFELEKQNGPARGGSPLTRRRLVNGTCLRPADAISLSTKAFSRSSFILS
jgi:hypothetical protein